MSRAETPPSSGGVSVRGMQKRYGRAIVVRALDLDIVEGEMLVLLGPSGCGKTTTMRCIAGLETPDAGLIRIGGRVVFDASRGIDVPINARNVGMVFQSYAIWPHMTVFENVAFPLRMQRVARAELADRVGQMLALVGLAQLAARSASQLSGGQMQRVALARSLVMRPSVLLFDEPLSNLDATLRERLRIQLRELQIQLKFTGVYVTHDQSEALALADRLAVMSEGEILDIGDPVTLYRAPHSRTVAGFLGYGNLFPVRKVSRSGGQLWVDIEGCDLPFGTQHVPAHAETLTLCIRPAEIGIRRGPGSAVAGDVTTTVCGKVILSCFLGPHMQYRVQIDGGAVLEVLCPNIADSIRSGEPVLLTIRHASVLVLGEA